jgi:hypothetical protein
MDTSSQQPSHHRPKPTLADYLHAARNEAPIVSWEESAERLAADIRLLERKKRRGAWWWWTEGLALTAEAIGKRLITLPIALQQPAPRFGVLMAMLLVAVIALPTLQTPHMQQQSGTANSSSNVNSSIESLPAYNHSQQAIHQPKTHVFTQPSAPRHTDSPQDITTEQQYQSALAFSTPSISTFSGNKIGREHAVTVAPDTSTLSTLSTSSASAPADAAVDATPSVVLASLNPKKALAETQSSIQHSSTLHSSALSAQSLESHMNDKTEVTKREKESEQGHWVSRLSVEYRLAARTDMGGAFGGTPLQNMALGAFYAIDNHHAVGIEGGTQPFFAGYRATSAISGAVAAQTFNYVGTTINAARTALSSPVASSISLLPPSMGDNQVSTTTSRFTTPPTSTASPEFTEPQSASATWFAAAYQYSAESFNMAGLECIPLARISLGGSANGGLGRALLGLQVAPSPRMRMLIGLEGTAIGGRMLSRTLVEQFQFSSQAGVTVGLSVKF